jgi:hypothetical protein
MWGSKIFGSLEQNEWMMRFEHIVIYRNIQGGMLLVGFSVSAKYKSHSLTMILYKNHYEILLNNGSLYEIVVKDTI